MVTLPLRLGCDENYAELPAEVRPRLTELTRLERGGRSQGGEDTSQGANQ